MRRVPQAATLRVATYNIHGAVGRDGRRDLSRVAAIIRETGADLVALQEVDSRPGTQSASEQMDRLCDMTGMRAVPGPTIVHHDRSYGNVLLSRLPVTRSPGIDISYRRREPRGAIDANIHTPAGTLRVVATHLGLGMRERVFQARRLASALSGYQGPLLLCGDLNEWLPLEASLRALRSLLPAPRRVATFPTPLPILALDRIWTRPASLLQRLAVHDSPRARRASDHLPLVGRLELTVPDAAGEATGPSIRPGTR